MAASRHPCGGETTFASVLCNCLWRINALAALGDEHIFSLLSCICACMRSTRTCEVCMPFVLFISMLAGLPWLSAQHCLVYL